jgi:hypothetical protein
MLPWSKRQQRRMKCGTCGAEWWWTPGSQINPQDHTRSNGRRCSASASEIEHRYHEPGAGDPHARDAEDDPEQLVAMPGKAGNAT